MLHRVSSRATLMLGEAFRSSIKETESYNTWEHFTTRGHSGKVLAIASSDETDYIVSGGEDYTMRIWVFDTETSSYDLCAVLVHDHEGVNNVIVAEETEGAGLCGCWRGQRGEELEPKEVTGVTAVACAGMQGPFISGTSEGDLFVLNLGSDEGVGSCVPYLALHQGPINEISVPSHLGENLEAKTWVVGVASDDGGSLLKFTEGGYTVCGLPHNGVPVKGIRHIAEGGEQDASFATHTEAEVWIWNLQQECIMKLEFNKIRRSRTVGAADDDDDEEQVIQDIAVANKDNGTLLFAGTKEVLAVWSFEQGKLCGARGDPTDDRTPLLIYKDEARMVDVDQSVRSTDFYVDVRDDGYTCAVWNLKGVEPDDLAIEPRGPASLLAAPKRKEMLLDLWHNSRVTQFRVAEDPTAAGGPCLVVACSDGSVRLWDLEGVDRGEIYAALRSLRPREIFLPVILLLVSFFQVISFAFGPAIKWRDEVRKPAHFTQKIAWGELDWVLKFPKDEVFFSMVSTVIGLICLFLFVTLTGTPELLNYLVHFTQSTQAYKRESRSLAPGKMHWLKWVLETLRWVLYSMVWLMATILVAPVFKVCAEAVSCVNQGDDPRWPKAHLAVAPQIECWRGTHLYLACTVFTLVPLYFIVLIPHGVLEGDARYMGVRKLFFPLRYWAESAHRKATMLNFGPLHPNEQFVFRTLFLDLASRAVLPVIETWSAPRPCLQMGLITLVGTVMYVSSLCWPPKHQAMFSCLVQGTRLFTLCAMLCGCLTVALPEGHLAPTFMLAVCLILVPWRTVQKMRKTSLTPPLVQKCWTSSLEIAEPTDNVVQQGTNNFRTESLRDFNVVWVGDRNDIGTMSNALSRRERARMGTLKSVRVRLF